MNMDKKLERRLRAQRLGSTYYSSKRIRIWSEEGCRRLQEWAEVAGDPSKTGKVDSTFLGLGSQLAQGALAGGSGHSLAETLANEFNKNFDAYDRAIDAAYTAGAGGGSALHHLLDGQHSLWGAWQAVRGVSTDDSFFGEIMQAIEHLVRDLCSVSGINPFFSLTRETFDTIASTLSPLGVTKAYLADALTVNGPEILGAALGICAILFGRKSLDPQHMAELTGSLLVAALAGANPLLLPVAGYAMYQCFKREGKLPSAALFRSLGKGALVTGTVLCVSSAIGGPVWVGLAAGVAAGIGVRAGVGQLEKLWKDLWPAYESFQERFPLALREIDVSAVGTLNELSKVISTPFLPGDVRFE
jgi:hypothetical protein